jgi:hypothetical protein
MSHKGSVLSMTKYRRCVVTLNRLATWSEMRSDQNQGLSCMRHSHAMIEAVRSFRAASPYSMLSFSPYVDFSPYVVGTPVNRSFGNTVKAVNSCWPPMAQAFATDARSYPQTTVMSEWLTNGIVGTDAIRTTASVNVSLAFVTLLCLVPLAIGKAGRMDRKTDGSMLQATLRCHPEIPRQFNGCKPHGQFFLFSQLGIRWTSPFRKK